MMNGKKNYGGYLAVAGGFILMAMLHSMLQGCFSLFLVPVTEDMGIRRSAFSLCSSIVALMSLLLSPGMGRWLSGRYARPIFLCCVGGLGLAYASYGLAQSPAMLYVSAALVGAFSCGATAIPISTTLTGWFPGSSGTAVSVAYAGSGIGGAILSPLITSAIADHGWHRTFLTFGLIMTAVALPAALFLLRPNPRAASAAAAAEAQAKTDDPLKLLWKRGYFYVYLLGIFAMSVVAFASMSQLSACLTDTYTPGFAAAVFSFFLLVLTPSKIVLGLLYDKKGVSFATVFVMGACAVSMVLLLLLGGSSWVAWVMAVFFAIGNCCGTVSPPVTTSAVFGTRYYGRLFGIVNLFLLVGNMVGPPMAAGLYDRFGSYRPAWIVCIACSLLSIVCVLYARQRCQKDIAWQQLETQPQ